MLVFIQPTTVDKEPIFCHDNLHLIVEIFISFSPEILVSGF